MLSVQPTPRPPVVRRPLLQQLWAVLRWPFRDRRAAPVWLALRLYLAWIWFQMGWGKLMAGWLTSDPVGDMLRLVAKGSLPVPLEFYRGVAAWLLDIGATPLISQTMPFLELAVALAFISGVLALPAAAGGILLIANIMLAGIGTLSFDGRIMLLHMLLLLAYPVIGVLGIEQPLARACATLVNSRSRSHPSVGQSQPAARRSLDQ